MSGITRSALFLPVSTCLACLQVYHRPVCQSLSLPDFHEGLIRFPARLWTVMDHASRPKRNRKETLSNLSDQITLSRGNLGYEGGNLKINNIKIDAKQAWKVQWAAAASMLRPENDRQQLPRDIIFSLHLDYVHVVAAAAPWSWSCLATCLTSSCSSARLSASCQRARGERERRLALCCLHLLASGGAQISFMNLNNT